MIKHVLIVDDDKEMLFALKSGLDKYQEAFSVLTGENGIDALSVMKKHPVSLIVTDLKMPKMDGFTLLAQIMEHYPDIPVIMMTAYSTPKMERLAKEGGAVGYIKKPFMIDELARQVITTMRKESEGGTLHGVSSGMFLQLIEMEERTCTIRLSNNTSEKKGVLFFRNGELMDARLNGRQGLEAAYEIFSWDDVTLSIQNVCPQKEKRIDADLQAILLEAMRLKDEADETPVSDQLFESDSIFEEDEDELLITDQDIFEDKNVHETIREKLHAAMGDRCGIDDVFPDPSWSGFIQEASFFGQKFKAGAFKAGYIDKGKSNDFILLPQEPAIVISVNPRCPRDRLLRVLMS